MMICFELKICVTRICVYTYNICCRIHIARYFSGIIVHHVQVENMSFPFQLEVSVSPSLIDVVPVILHYFLGLIIGKLEGFM